MTGETKRLLLFIIGPEFSHCGLFFTYLLTFCSQIPTTFLGPSETLHWLLNGLLSSCAWQLAGLLHCCELQIILSTPDLCSSDLGTQLLSLDIGPLRSSILFLCWFCEAATSFKKCPYKARHLSLQNHWFLLEVNASRQCFPFLSNLKV